ncbi:endo-1,4-beta-xylanase [Aliiglaciecola lipolytica]|uniref:endo-1,4-beta-xylanase n=1 Tax=Aliiglaciecola lipolytica TaxID=477689 RepID=UPI001C0867A1|nr:endo-1,4-beta-xylanase [Aliiglaciecola lipolytica]MBU2879926.1 endo-1,4-beta-xylanase [Aliiglaciecola lipolytica]
MHKNKLTIAILFGVSSFTLGCNNSTEQNAATTPIVEKAPEQSTLKARFKDHFKIGTAISRDQILGVLPDDLNVAKAQFNTFTPENSMKWERIHPQPDVYDFEAPDALVEYAQENNQELVGHTLVWHSQTPDWVFEDEQGEPLTREALLKRMQDHIFTVAGRYRDRIFAWDVVNEALNEDGTLRESKWSTIIGDDFIEYAFTYAKQAAPNAKLYYNDYNLYKPEKRAGALALIKNLQSKGIQIDGIGMQAHYSLDNPELSLMEDSIVAYAATGIDVMITELDISVLPFPESEEQGADISLDIALQERFNPYPDGLPSEVNKQLGKRYKEVFAILKKHGDKISRVTFWGVSDARTWRNDWPMQGRTDYPLLIDRELKLKSFVNDL